MNKKDSKGRQVLYKENLTGTKIGRLKVLSFNRETKKWICKCDCGNKVEVLTKSLKTGHTKSCGCLNKGYDKVSDNDFRNFKKLKKLWSRISIAGESSDWKDWLDFRDWAIERGYFGLLSIKKEKSKKPFGRANYRIGIPYKGIFIKVEDFEEYHIFSSPKENKFSISFRYNGLHIFKENISSIEELAEEHINLYHRYFNKKSVFEK